METVKLSIKGQIVIPKAIRETQHLTPGTELAISVVGDEIRIRPIENATKTDLASVAGRLYRPGRRRLDDSDTERAIAKMLATADRETK